ncbi:hypothetical protein GCM10023322_24150 [Rugosimonospora acidiphila]|uniref:Uncharacterized protein n=1 Tax=Rugosimonospora acidiphila TaxID=556531 RepID=A0ABP9RPU7_9ACTN
MPSMTGGDDGMGWAERYRAVHDALGVAPPAGEELVDALRLIPALREDLDGIERATIDAARRAGASWTEIASALGLRSRQAAEQRRLRLGASDAGRDATEARRRRQRQRSVDNAAGEGAAGLRAAVEDLVNGLGRMAVPGAARPAVVLARRTLLVALDADPGALVDLARLAIDDLGPVVATGAGGRPVDDAVRRIRELVEPTH